MAACMPFEKAIKPFPEPSKAIYTHAYEPTLPDHKNFLPEMMSARTSEYPQDMTSLNQQFGHPISPNQFELLTRSALDLSSTVKVGKEAGLEITRLA